MARTPDDQLLTETAQVLKDAIRLLEGDERPLSACTECDDSVGFICMRCCVCMDMHTLLKKVEEAARA